MTDQSVDDRRARASVTIDGARLALADFPSRFLASAVLGMLRELKGFREGSSIVVQIDTSRSA